MVEERMETLYFLSLTLMNTPEVSNNYYAIGWDFTHQGIGVAVPAVKLTAANAPALVLVGSGYLGGALRIDVDADSATRAYGLQIAVDNAGTNGLVCGIDFSGFAKDEPIFSVVADTNATAGTLSAQFPVLMGSTVYYVNLYTQG